MAVSLSLIPPEVSTLHKIVTKQELHLPLHALELCLDDSLMEIWHAAWQWLWLGGLFHPNNGIQCSDSEMTYRIIILQCVEERFV